MKTEVCNNTVDLFPSSLANTSFFSKFIKFSTEKECLNASRSDDFSFTQEAWHKFRCVSSVR